MMSRKILFISMFASLLFSVGCGSSGSEGSGSQESGITPFIQADTQIDPGPVAGTTNRIFEFSKCTNSVPKFTLEEVQQGLALFDIYYVDATEGWHTSSVAETQAIEYFKALSASQPGVNWNVPGTHTVSLKYELDFSQHSTLSPSPHAPLETVTVEVDDNPLCTMNDSTL